MPTNKSELIKFSDDELDVDELENAEWDKDADYSAYAGDIPPAGTILCTRIKKMWLTFTDADAPMLVVLHEAQDNEGDEEEYNGLPIWERVVFQPNSAWRYKPFCIATGIVILDVKKKMRVEEGEDNIGIPIVSIGKYKPGDEGNDPVWVVTKRDRYQGNWNAKVQKWLSGPPEDDEEDEEPEERPAARRGRTSKPATSSARPARSRKAAAEPEPEDEDEEDEEELEGEDEDEDEEEVEDTEGEDEGEEEEDEPEPPKQTRTSRPSSRTSSARSSKTSGTRSASAGAKSTATSRRTASKGSKDDPPF